jgi:ATP-binding protein involved in chromosome partitioning
MVKREQLWQVLKEVQFPGFDQNVLGVVQRLEIEDGNTVVVGLGIAHMGAKAHQATAEAIEAALTALPGVQYVRVEVEPRSQPLPPPEEAPRPGIRRVIAVGSGKGGVGKSTVSVNLAVALAQQGLRVGIMDADIFGPNVPRMLGVTELPPNENGGIPPAEAHGVKLVSVGLLVGANQAVVWRGPMTDKIIRQFLNEVDWGDLDVLVVDLPPGTGDIAISLAKHAQPDGAVVVVTPQEVALDDARKAVSMFRRLNVPVLGLVENMSYFECDECGTRHFLFGQGGGERLSQELGIPLLGQLPFEPTVRAGGDEGSPAATHQNSVAGTALRDVAQQVLEALATQEAQQPT